MLRAHHEMELRKVVEAWWRSLRGLDPASGEDRGREPDRGEVARLRRIGASRRLGEPGVDVLAALESESFRQNSSGRLGLWPWVAACLRRPLDDERIEFAAVAAATLAQIREDRPGETASMLGGDDPLFAESRFRKLIRTEQAADLLDQGRRIAAMLGQRAPVGELGASLILWSVDPNIKRRWTLAYYGLRSPGGHKADTSEPATADGAQA